MPTCREHPRLLEGHSGVGAALLGPRGQRRGPTQRSHGGYDMRWLVAVLVGWGSCRHPATLTFIDKTWGRLPPCRSLKTGGALASWRFIVDKTYSFAYIFGRRANIAQGAQRCFHYATPWKSLGVTSPSVISHTAMISSCPGIRLPVSQLETAPGVRPTILAISSWLKLSSVRYSSSVIPRTIYVLWGDATPDLVGCTKGLGNGSIRDGRFLGI